MTRVSFITTLILVVLLSACSEPPNNVFQGYVEGEYTHVAAPRGGTLLKLPVTRGETVSKGELLFSLERDFEAAAVNEARHALQAAQDNLANLEKGSRPSEIASIQARLKQAKASASLAEIEYERRQRLIRAQTISQEELDRAQSDYEQKQQAVRQINAELRTARLGARSDEIRAAMAQVLQSQARLEQTVWNYNQKRQSAPTNAFVFDTLYNVGEWVPSGYPVVSLLPPEKIEIRFFVPQTIISAVSTGQTAQISIDGMSEKINASINYISPEAEYTPPVIYSSESRAKLVFMIKARPNADAATLHPGQPVDVILPDMAP